MGKPTKYQLVKDEIRKRIDEKYYKVGEKIPAESQLMAYFDVSRHTIRQAISSLVNEGILEKVQGSGTFVVETINERPIKRTKTIGVITTYLSDYIFPSIIRGIEEELSLHGYSMLLASTQNDVEQEKKSLEMMLQQHVDGLIIEPTKSSFLNPNLPYYLQLKNNNTPFIYLHSSYPEMEAPIVAVDDVAATALATKHLLELGHQKIALVTKHDDSQGRNRLKGFIQSLANEEVSIPHDYIMTYETHTQPLLPGRVAELLGSANRPTAIVAYNDQVALMIEQGAREVGLSIPDDLSLVSHDASGLRLNSSKSKLTSMEHPKEKMGRDAAKLVLKAISPSSKEVKSITYEPQIIIQESTKSPL